MGVVYSKTERGTNKYILKKYCCNGTFISSFIDWLSFIGLSSYVIVYCRLVSRPLLSSVMSFFSCLKAFPKLTVCGFSSKWERYSTIGLNWLTYYKDQNLFWANIRTTDVISRRDIFCSQKMILFAVYLGTGPSTLCQINLKKQLCCCGQAFRPHCNARIRIKRSVKTELFDKAFQSGKGGRRIFWIYTDVILSWECFAFFFLSTSSWRQHDICCVVNNNHLL